MRPEIEITPDLLRRIAYAPTKAKVVDAIAPHLTEMLPQAGVKTPLRVAHFLAQAAHETDHFRTLREYWGPTAAQRGYEGRKDLGNVQKGDGIRYLGRGIFQLTGRTNYRECGKALGFDLEGEPQLAERPDVAVRTACWYWSTRKRQDKSLNDWADLDDAVAITKAINGGTNGLAMRLEMLGRAKEALAG